LLNAKGSGAYDAMIKQAEQCMADYDDNGWTGEGLDEQKNGQP